MIDWHAKSTRITIIIITLLIAVGWVLIEKKWNKNQSYQGQVLTKSKKIRLGKSHRNKFYLTIMTNEGDKFRVRVPRHIFTKFRQGDRITKQEGDQYPQPEKSSVHTLSVDEAVHMIKQAGSTDPAP